LERTCPNTVKAQLINYWESLSASIVLLHGRRLASQVFVRNNERSTCAFLARALACWGLPLHLGFIAPPRGVVNPNVCNHTSSSLILALIQPNAPKMATITCPPIRRTCPTAYCLRKSDSGNSKRVLKSEAFVCACDKHFCSDACRARHLQWEGCRATRDPSQSTHTIVSC
jgi:hypothetical protein